VGVDAATPVATLEGAEIFHVSKTILLPIPFPRASSNEENVCSSRCSNVRDPTKHISSGEEGEGHAGEPDGLPGQLRLLFLVHP
jgi:hypothetical protein